LFNIRIKIADIAGKVKFSSHEAGIVTPSGKVKLPEEFYAFSGGEEKLSYQARLLHLHSEDEADKHWLALSRQLTDKLKIVEAGERWVGRGIERHWIVSSNYGSFTEAADFLRGAKATVEAEYRYRTEVESGIFTIYPEMPGGLVTLTTERGMELHSGKTLRLESPDGIVFSQAPVGETFHWEHREDLTFKGIIELRPGEKGLLVIAEMPLEEYLASVNSSEMSALSPVEFLKAQTLAARGTVAATIGCHHYGEPFHLCNGDHCQCFYGSGRLESRSEQAAEETAGQVLLYQGIIADTRYAKTCGGFTETYDRVWENYNPGYLPEKYDGKRQEKLTNAEKYIQENPHCWCNPKYHPYPEYYKYAEPWFRWEKEFYIDTLTDLVELKTGKKIGTVKRLVPLERGVSGRITRLRIEGEREVEICGELNIRRVLSDSHLPSSCFLVEETSGKIRLKGAGWGHGVGMCQMGALNMAISGKSCEEILRHYYPGTGITKFF